MALLYGRAGRLNTKKRRFLARPGSGASWPLMAEAAEDDAGGWDDEDGMFPPVYDEEPEPEECEEGGTHGEEQGERDHRGSSGGSLEPPGPLLTHLHTVLRGVF
jgi:hypothetical protein